MVNATPTAEQDSKMKQLMKQGYMWDKPMSASSAAVVLRKGNDLWFFGMQGEIDHNPQITTIKLNNN